MAPQGTSEITAREEIFSPLHERLLGMDRRICDLKNVIEQLARTSLAVIITGETGTGKDIVARLLHQRSFRRDKPFIKVNCPSIPVELFESELFGYEPGAFTGATVSHPGRFELAQEGTLFLDEISEIPPDTQTKLLQVLDGEPYMPVGGSKTLQARARVIAATNVPLDQAMEEGRLRKDVAFRLGETVVHIPPLRERRGDIPLLAEHFNYNMCLLLKRPYTPLPLELAERLQARDWPGNVRELASRVKEYVATGSQEALLGPEPVEGNLKGAPAPTRAPGGRPGTPEAVPERQFVSLKEAARQAAEAAERALIEEALRHTLWNRRKAAKLLKTSYSSLLRRIEEYSIGKT